MIERRDGAFECTEACECYHEAPYKVCTLPLPCPHDSCETLQLLCTSVPFVAPPGALHIQALHPERPCTLCAVMRCAEHDLCMPESHNRETAFWGLNCTKSDCGPRKLATNNVSKASARDRPWCTITVQRALGMVGLIIGLRAEGKTVHEQ